MSADAMAKSIGLDLTTGAAPLANYVPAVLAGNFLVVSGQLPLSGGLAARHKGKLGREVSDEAGHEAARIAATNVLAQAKATLGSLDRIKRVVRLGGFINAAAGYTTLPAVMNGASDLMVQVFGERGRHARTTVGVAELPLDAAVEIEAMFEILA